MSEHDATRRLLLTALASLPLVGIAAPGNTLTQGSRTLVVYFTRTGNTRVIAGLIHRALKTDLFEIVPTQPYPDDYLTTVAQASKEREQGMLPAFNDKPADLHRWQTIYLGFPIWGTTVPQIVRSFLHAFDFQGKTVIPFITHGGYGAGDSIAVIQRMAPGAKVEEPFVMEADQERRTMEKVQSWLHVS